MSAARGAMPKTYNIDEPKTETLEEVLAQYKSTAKRVGINIVKVKPNYCVCKLVRHLRAALGEGGQELILPDNLRSQDELIFEVVLAGEHNNENVYKAEVGDLLVLRDASPIRFRYTTKLEVLGEEYPIYHMVSNDSILYKVEYTKID